jgi:hypothetical protein
MHLLDMGDLHPMGCRAGCDVAQDAMSRRMRQTSLSLNQTLFAFVTIKCLQFYHNSVGDCVNKSCAGENNSLTLAASTQILAAMQ